MLEQEALLRIKGYT